MDELEYIEKRLQDQIDWYDRKSIGAQKWFKCLRTFELIAAAAIPLFSGFSALLEYQPQLPLLVGSLGFLVTVVAGLMGLNQFQERWVEYRATCEALKREKYLYLAHAYPYDGEHQLPSLVQNVEGLLVKETSAWGQYMRAAGKPKPAPAGEESVPAAEPQTPRPETGSGGGSNASSGMLGQVQGAIDVVKGVAGVLLPGMMGGKVAEIAMRVEDGVEVFKEATKQGVVPAAASAVAEVLGEAGPASPLRAIVGKALSSFGPVLGTAAPPIGLVLAVGTVAVKLGRDAYVKWKARILHLPFAPATGTPLQVVDANTGFSLFQQSPIFAAAFAKAMGDRKFLKDAALEFTGKTNVESLWQKYQRRGQFESRQEFEDGLDEFRRTAADAELQTVVDPGWVSGAGGYQQMLSDVDILQLDPEARTDLEALMDTVEKMQENNEPVLEQLAELQKEHNS